MLLLSTFCPEASWGTTGYRGNHYWNGATTGVMFFTIKGGYMKVRVALTISSRGKDHSQYCIITAL